MSVRLILRSSCEFVRDRARGWNLFNTRSSDPLIIRQEILSTRLYIILVMISLIILTTYTTINNRIENKTVTFPSQSLYEKLQKKYSDSLECSCTKVSIPHGKFVRIIPKFHQVCLTDFVSQKWIDFIFKVNVELIMPFDVRTSMSAIWQLIRSFCQSATNTTIDALDQFENSPWVNPTLVTKQILNAKVQTTLNLSRQTTASNFIQSIKFVHKMAQANQLITGLLTNYIATTKAGIVIHFAFPPQAEIKGNIYIQKGSMRRCSCKDEESCPLPGNLYLYDNNIKEKRETYDLNQIEANESLAGIIIDCLPIQSTFLSSLECFYDQSCLNIFLSTYQTKMNISILNQSLTSRFSLNTTIESLVEELFLEEIFNKTIYSEYYSECLPYICTYVYFHRFNWISVMTVIIAIFGGITAVLSIIAPLIVQLILFIKKRFFSKESATEQVAQDQNETIRTRLKKLFNTVKIKIINLNLYDTNSRDSTRIYHEILSTRLYLFSLFISINIYILYADFSNQTVTEKILNPFQYDYENLAKRHSSRVTCPCTEISILYKDIINITVDYHQVCRSHFIQSSWYDRFSLSNTPYSSSYKNIEFLSIAASKFRILETFCSLANETINDAKKRFLSRNLINSQLLTSNLFYSQINSSIDTFKQSTKTEFLDRTNLTNVLLHSNQYLSRTITNTRLKSIFQNMSTGLYSVKMLIFPIYTINTNNDKCYCVIDSTCHLNHTIYDEDPLYGVGMHLEGVHIGCSIINTVMQSSLICWFNKNCIYQVRRFVERYNISVHENSTILLDRNLSSRYHPNTTIETIFNEMMIEEWNISRSFASYFLKCKPSFCSVTYEKKANIIYIITVIVGLIGGINVILNLISPLIIKIIFKIINKLKRQRPSQNLTEEQDNNHQNDEIGNNVVFNLMKRLINRLLLLNLFDDESTHIETIRRQRISTRVYIVVLSISMCIIAMYTMFSDRHKPQIFLNPSQNDYNRLLKSYSELLKCPCKNISIEYKHFIQINTTFHVVCSSDFISKKWHDYLFGRANWYYYDRRDIRVRGASYSLFLSKLCQISQTTINNALNQFLNTTFINTHMISISEFDSQINDIISQFKNNTLTIFSRRLKLFRDILNGNAFVSSYSLNWYFYREYNSTSDINPIQPVKMTNKCSCGTRSDCIDPGGVYDTLNNTAKFLIPGWNVGCSVVETLLHSTFECLYDQICLNSLLSNIEQYTFEHSHYINISAMSFLNHSHFKPNTTIQNIADELFVEEWNNITSYSSFYKQCNPQECSYKIERDNYFASISSNILGLYGGLTVVLRFSIPFVIEIIFKIRNRCRRNTVVPTE
ncbi:unnamed protein product [Adineta steineri]|uniref:Uncharacterized protein n=1 Tax=Adineta steineri TaxID=433720 RepID=A0A816B2A7_9BILA|nr:unnamed protein product [Adineta steineri]CAF1605752.1 unnamed protein product [Adineta steineri]